MSKLARALLLGAVLAAMSVAGTAAAQGRPADQPTNAPGMRRPNVEGPVRPSWQGGQDARQERAAAATAARRRLARQQAATPAGTPVAVTSPPPAYPAGQHAAPGALVAALALVAGVAALAATRTRRGARARRAGPTRTAAPSGRPDDRPRPAWEPGSRPGHPAERALDQLEEVRRSG
jgi:hypothetical protein